MKKGILLLVVSLLVGIFVWYFKTFYEQYDKEVVTGYTIEAKRNPFLAAKLFLQDNEVHFVEKNDELDFNDIGTNEVVFLSDVDDMILTESQVKEALEWVGHGGSLIVGVGNEIQGNASLLERFDILPIEYHRDLEDIISDGQTLSQRLRERNEEIDDQENNPDQSNGEGYELSFDDVIDDALGITDEGETYTVYFSEEVGELTLQVQDRIVLNHPQAPALSHDLDVDDDELLLYGVYEDDYSLDFYAGDSKGSRFLQFTYGEGRFTALSSSNIWENSNIDDADHAFLLALFVPDKSSVRFFYNVVSPTLSVLLKRYFGESLLAALLLLIVWLWRSSLRVQVVKQELTTQRRAFSEHLKASAEFLISKEQYALLLEPIQADINAQMRLLHPGYNDLTPDEQIPVLSIQTELAKETIRSWFDALQSVESQEHMIATLKVGSAIRNKL